MTVFVYVNTAKQVGDVDHIKVFATVDADRSRTCLLNLLIMQNRKHTPEAAQLSGAHLSSVLNSHSTLAD